MLLSVVVVGILNKVNRVGSCVVVLFDLEVGSGEAERTQNHVAQILKFTYVGKEEKKYDEVNKTGYHICLCLFISVKLRPQSDQ